eukprot:11916228-Prorocentrum_lima.AAC.1
MHSIPTITSRLLCGLVMRCLQIILFALPYKDSDKTDSIRAIWQQDTFSKNMKVATMNLLIRQLPV